MAVDTTSKKPENRIRKMAIGARMRLKIVYLPEQGNRPAPGFVWRTSDLQFMQIIQEFSIEQGITYT